ncbi:PTS fructose-like transporter subunit IIB [Caenispirillum bisanense]|uniref:protein-N(pi)-phosphohistidine--D-fructose phosphotransferase n=1 Tax=Caenispirillum bisanense TaxID=414052 RepID=A0A286GSN3_9PROT|nr:PTS fructose-like transporter subunit IIB [Caenispirillum bisanense]SOD98206.1 PTS system, fructose-specific IIC component [Caenispirillum bisanense]
MARIVAVTACPTGIAHTFMAAEALKKQASLLGHDIAVETRGSAGAGSELTFDQIEAADVVILAADTTVPTERFGGKPIHSTSTAAAIRDPRAVIEAALGRQAPASSGRATAAPPPPPPPADEARAEARAERGAVPEPVPAAPAGGKRLVAITACPTGIAHTFMAAESLRKAALEMGHAMKVETQGSVGAKNQLTDEDIRDADAVVIAADMNVATDRFAGKAMVMTSTAAALKNGRAVIEQALATPAGKTAGEGAAGAATGAAGSPGYQQEVQRAKQQLSAQRAGPYKHLLTGVSYMLPLVVAGGLLIALSFVWGIDAFEQEGTIPAALMQIGGGAAFALMVPILAGFIAYSIADRPGIAPGLIGGMLASQLGAGFLGGIIAGFIAGYVSLFLRDRLPLPQTLEGLKPVLIIPLIAGGITGLLMIYVVGAPVKAIMDGLTAWLNGLSGTNAVLLGVLLGAMMAFDMGGPVNKAAYTFSVGLLGSDTFGPMAATMAAGMTPPLGLALATFIARRKFNAEEQEAGKAAGVLGICFITEGAIPFAAKDPVRVIPCIMAGSAVTGALSMFFGCTLRAPHGGIFVLGIPNAVGNLGMYIVAIVVGTLVTAGLVAAVKRPLDHVQVPAETAPKAP